ncbi:alpha/beta hydrolase [Rhizobiales bacterium]|uniref:alpha/beta fold hydrolase n=1 Tax=Hongsoonwoonella zoysiae TaxID=2821844 RepID=UPI00155FF5B1|nr:alpha/beta hydrolase [Hongsoonwoonella zoysiae]NRG18456.1 alpha/beta hydrolase [Hongsoonwoonella zoysiae]
MPDSGESSEYGAGWTLREWRGKDGLRLRARDWKPNTLATAPLQDILCLAGLSRNARDFDPVARYLSAHGHRVVAMDYRGRGASERDHASQDYSLPTEGEDILLGLEALGIGDFSVIGTSRGGIHAMLLALQIPERVKAIVLNDIGPKIEFQGLLRLSTIIGKTMREPSRKAAAERLKSTYGDTFTRMNDDDWHAFARQLYTETGDGVQLDYDPALANTLNDLSSEDVPDLWPIFNSLPDIPLMMVHGENSDILTNETVEKALEARPGMALLEIPGEGHAPLLWDETSRSKILSFLAATT